MNSDMPDAPTSRQALRVELERLDTLLCDMGPSEERRSHLRKRASMQAQLDAGIYPVLTLPPEVVSEIFIHCLSDTRARLNVAEAPLLLCNVCRAWRDIAIATPPLWSSLELTFKFSLFGTNFLDLLDLWLSRTGSHRLSLSVCYDEYTSGKRRHQLNQLVMLLMRHSEQWADVELKLPDASEFHHFKGEFPALETLSVAHPVEPPTYPVTSFAHAPRLTTVQLSLGCALEPLVLPWAQLKVLKCESLYVDDCLKLLRETTQIVELTVYLREDGPTPSARLLLLPTLRSLHLLREECHIDLLQYLTLPSLEKLSISFQEHDIPRFVSFLSRSACALRYIIFDAWAFNQAELLQCFEAMPALQELKLWRPRCFTDALLHQLSLADVLPNLKTLELSQVYPIQFTVPALVGMLSARWGTAAPVRLQSFRTVLHKASTVMDPESVFRLQGLVASGMDIRIGYH
ncbi:hypothetical protein B0H19DRAFT_171959 [Mycena capillaripes]|nr:hypothetical protein B0H19DRAFT_171959 [Mycena capillaripes]